jgi:hypothetical protein
MSDASQREWRFYLNDMIDFVGKVLAYTEGFASAIVQCFSWLNCQVTNCEFRCNTCLICAPLC